MGNYRFDDNLHKEKPLPAGWRGVGCLIILLLPIIAYAAAVTLLQEIDAVKIWLIQVSPSLFGAPSLPRFLWEIKVIRPLLNEILTWKNLEVNLLFAFVLLIPLSGIVNMIYGLMYRAVAPPRYGPKDAPPPKYKPKKYKR